MIYLCRTKMIPVVLTLEVSYYCLSIFTSTVIIIGTLMPKEADYKKEVYKIMM